MAKVRYHLCAMCKEALIEERDTYCMVCLPIHDYQYKKHWAEANRERRNAERKRRYQARRAKATVWQYYRLEYDPNCTCGSPCMLGGVLIPMIERGVFDPGTVFSGEDEKYYQVSHQQELVPADRPLTFMDARRNNQNYERFR